MTVEARSTLCRHSCLPSLSCVNIEVPVLGISSLDLGIEGYFFLCGPAVKTGSDEPEVIGAAQGVSGCRGYESVGEA